MKDGRRVLFCTLGYEPGRVGGAERQARLQAQELARRGWRVDVVTARDPGTPSGRMDGLMIRRLPRLNVRFLRTLTYAPMLVAWLLGNVRRYDVVHVHLANWQADLVIPICRLFHVPAYVKLAAGGPRGEIGRMRKVAWLTRYVGIRGATRAQATSNEIEADLKAIGVPGSRIVRIPNGLPPGVFVPPSAAQRKARRRELNLPGGKPLVLYCGRFARYKGVTDLIEAWDGSQAASSAVLVLVGVPAIDDPVEVDESPSIEVRPWTTEVAAYLQACDIYVHPSHADGMPNAVLEAMASGAAVIATRIAAIPEMLTDGVDGLLVASGSVEELRQAIDSLVADPALTARLSSAAALRAARDYPIEAVVDRIEVAYREMLATRPR